jgi:hypothetical protein
MIAIKCNIDASTQTSSYKHELPEWLFTEVSCHTMAFHDINSNLTFISNSSNNIAFKNTKRLLILSKCSVKTIFDENFQKRFSPGSLRVIEHNTLISNQKMYSYLFGKPAKSLENINIIYNPLLWFDTEECAFVNSNQSPSVEN